MVTYVDTLKCSNYDVENFDDVDNFDDSDCEENFDVEKEHWTEKECLMVCNDIVEALYSCGLSHHYLYGAGMLEPDMYDAFMVGRDPSEGLGIGTERFLWMIGLIEAWLEDMYHCPVYPVYKGHAKWVDHRHTPKCKNCPFKEMRCNQ